LARLVIQTISGPIDATQLKTRWRTAQGETELMAKKQNLGFQATSRLEQVDDQHSDQAQERQHHHS
jgi:hypothetical protein